MRAHRRIAKHYQKYDGRLSFTTDGWIALNHKAFIAVTVHLEQQGEVLALLLDVIEVSRV